MSNILVVGDTHDMPLSDKKRFQWAREVADHYLEEDDWIVQMGDFGDWLSFSSFDQGTKGHVNENYAEDFRSCAQAWKIFHSSRYRYAVVEGNHEYRIKKALKADYRLEGSIDMDLLPWRQDPTVAWVPYQQKLAIEGVYFTHHLTTRMGRAATGTAQHLFRKFRSSLVVGHSHTWDWFEEAIDNDKRQFCMIAGHLSHPHHAEEEWCAGVSHDWWAGVTILYDVKDGYPRGGIIREPYQP